jgi:hypothetical protein
VRQSLLANHNKYTVPPSKITHRKAGTANTKLPKPAMQIANSKPQPTGTATMNLKAERSPWLAAKAVDRAVLGPGVKLAAVDSTNKAVNSSGLKTKFMQISGC